MIQSASLFDVLLMKVAAWRSFLPHGLQAAIPSFSHASRGDIIAAIRAMHGHGYPLYVEGMALPDGVHAPLPGFCHHDLLDTVGNACEGLMVRHGMDKRLSRELTGKLQEALRRELESRGAEYQLGTFFQRPYKYRVSKTNNLYVLAEEYRAITQDTALAFVSTISTRLIGMEISKRQQICVQAANAMRDHILQLVARV
ncbi:MAG: hypothetical protein ABWY05_11855 [Noviherbaspirillum sp.]